MTSELKERIDAIRAIVANKGGELELHCIGNPPILIKEDIYLNDEGFTRFYGDESMEETIKWDDADEFEIDIIEDCLEANADDFNVEIFKECEDGKLTMEEVDLILQWTEKDFKFYNDKANGYIAFALSNCDREDADNLVSLLNKRCGEDNWYLGALGEEYVFVD